MNRIKKTREAERLSQCEFAARIGVSQAMVSLFENGQRKPTQEVAENIYKVLGIPVEELMDEPDIKVIFARNAANLNVKQLKLLNEVVKEITH